LAHLFHQFRDYRATAATIAHGHDWDRNINDLQRSQVRAMLPRERRRDIKPHLRTRRLIQMDENFTELHLSFLPRNGA